MKVLLTPHYQKDLGLIILKPGTELIKQLGTGRLVISSSSSMHSKLPAGIIKDQQQLLDNQYLIPFLLNDKVFSAAGGKEGLCYWLTNTVKNCQLVDGQYCYHECTNKVIGDSAIRVCWHHEKQETNKNIEKIALNNKKAFVIDSIIRDLRLGTDHILTLPELLWWAVIKDVYSEVSEDLARLSVNRPIERITHVYKESDIVTYDDRERPQLINKIKPVREAISTIKPNLTVQVNIQDKPTKQITIDPESPESFMLRPKLKRWECSKYTQWVKTQPCVCCGKPSDDPHHIIGHGQGKMSGKAHDIFTLPLCRQCHNELHKSVSDWEDKNGSQVDLLFKFLDYAFGVNVIA